MYYHYSPVETCLFSLFKNNVTRTGFKILYIYISVSILIYINRDFEGRNTTFKLID